MFFTDLGSYVTTAGVSVLPIGVLLEAGVEGAVFKGDQEDLSRGVSTTRSMQQAYDGGMKTVGCFYWDDPTVAVSILLDSYKRAIEREKPEFISVDIEQYWDWSNNVLAPNLINDHAQRLTEGLAEAFPELLLMPYSAKYMLSYAPGLAKWIDHFENWTAAWTDSPMPRYRLTLPEIARGDCRQTLYGADGKPLRNPDGSYLYSTYDIKDHWQASTSQKVCLLRQYSSRILLPYDRVGGTIYDHQYDWNYTPLTIDEWKKKIRKEEVSTMAGTYKTSVSQDQRGRFVLISSDDKQVDVAALAAGVDAIAMQMCSQISDGMTIVKDGAFQTWAPRSTVPVIGWIPLDQDLFWKKEIDLNSFRDSAKRNMWNNETLRAIIEQWRANPIPAAEWNAKKLNITAGDGGWIKLGALVLHMSTTVNPAHGSKIGGAWQQAIVDDLLKPLTTLMQGGFIPTVKIFIMASWDWYKAYADDTGWTPAARIANKQLAGLGLTRVWGQPATGLLTEVPMATPYPTLTEVWQNVPADTYTYPLTLTDIDFQFFVFSFNRLRAVDMFYTGNTPTPVTCGIWCDTVANMSLGAYVPPTEPPVEPPVTPPVDLTPILDKLTLMDAKLDKMVATVTRLSNLLDMIENMFK